MKQFVHTNWNNKKYSSLKAWLKNNSNPKYKQFQEKIINTKFPIIGVKIPTIRNIANNILKGNAKSFLEVCKEGTFEEIILKGIIISKLNISFNERIKIFEQYTNIIDNWAVCDIVTGSLKDFSNNKTDGYEYILKCIHSKNPWKIRVGIVSMISFYVDELYIEEILAHCKYISDKFSKLKTKLSNKHGSPYYYVKMANAWLISVCFAKFPTTTKTFLETNQIEDETFKMSIQKIIDSHRVSTKDKTYVKQLKQLHNNIKQCKQ